MARSRLPVAVASAVALALAPTAAAAHGQSAESRQASSSDAGVSVPLVTSPNVRLVDTVPYETGMISGAFARTGSYFYASSLDSISVFDTSDPLHPRLVGTVDNLVFENESMTYGERRRGGEVSDRFVLVGADLYQASSSDIQHVNVGGGELLVVDVTDPTRPHVRSRVEVPDSTHTVACVDEWDCRYAYSVGDGGQFSVIDLGDLDAPRVSGSFPSAASGPNPVFSRGAGHHWSFDGTGLGWHTGSGGTAVFDVRDPANPVPVEATDANGIAPGWNDFIHHNSKRPNGSKFRPDAPPSLANGNVLLVTEEDYLNDGDEVVCDRAGSVQTWWVKSLDGAAYRAGDPATPGTGTITPLDSSNVPAEFGGGLTLPAGAFCSAHWFDYHQSGILAQGFYAGGLRLVDVRDPRNIAQYGYATGGATEVWDAYWVPQRNSKGMATGKKTNIVYTADLVRGIDVYTVDLPSKDLGDTGSTLPPLLGLTAL
ncbi:MAG: hypothetical protein ACOYXW_11125 [Actinomycetota bacterium]